MKSIFKIFTIFTSEQRRYCLLIVSCMIIGALFEAVGIGAIFPLISIMGNSEFLAEHKYIQHYAEMFCVESHTDFVEVCAMLLICFYIIKNFYMVWQSSLQVKFSKRNQIYYAKELMRKYLGESYTYHLDQNSAVLLRNVNSGPAVTFSGMLVPTFSLITEIFTALAIFFMLMIVDIFTALVILFFLGGLLYGVLKMFRRKIMRHGQVQKKYSVQYIKWVNQGLGAIKETKVLQKEYYFLNKFSEAYEKFSKANCDFLFLNQLPKFIIEMAVVCGLLLIIIIKLAIGETTNNIVPVLGVLALAAFRLMPCANRIINLYNTIKFQMPLFDEVYPVFMDIKQQQMLNGKICPAGERIKMVFEKMIEVQKLAFQYSRGKKMVFESISFKIPKGSFVGIVGPSGAGKTTFVDILIGLLSPTEGAILVDDKNIQENISSWRLNLAYVPQSIYLIDGTIEENIALGIDEDKINKQLLEKVLMMAELDEFVNGLPEKLNEKVGERGVKLSGGQRQRIGIARALYCQPEVLVLDEATSALDNETEKSITNTLLKLKGHITIIAVAHRISTLEACDFKLCFKDGNVEIIT